MSFTDCQKIRAGRAILGWPQKTLAARAGITAGTLNRFEKGARSMHPNNRTACFEAFAKAGVLFENNTITYHLLPPISKLGEPTHD